MPYQPDQHDTILTRAAVGLDSTTHALLSLYLILLAFFVLLVAGVRFEPERTHRAIEGVRRTFSGGIHLFAPIVPRTPTSEEASLLERVRRRLPVLAGASARATDGHGVLIEVPLDRLLRRDGRSLSPAAAGWLDGLAALVDEDEDAQAPLALFLLAGGAPGTTDARTATRASPAAPAHLVASDLIARGAAATRLRVGFAPSVPQGRLAIVIEAGEGHALPQHASGGTRASSGRRAPP